jgi:glycine dehydrogenase
MVTSLTGLDVANASLLDEATAAAEAMVMTFAFQNSRKKTFVVDAGVSPQTLSVLKTRAKGFGINLVTRKVEEALEDEKVLSQLCGVLVQYPDVDGHVRDFEAISKQVHDAGALVTCATDLLALTLLKPPGEWDADIAFGNSARFGVPIGYGGPHAAFFAVKDTLKRKMPGRLVGRSKDASGKLAYRLALQSESYLGAISGSFVDEQWNLSSSRAAHSSGKGHEQHLYQSSASCQYGSDVRGVPWTRRHYADR